MSIGIVRRIADVWRAEGPAGVSRKIFFHLHYRAERMFGSIRRTVRAGRGQSESVLVAASQRYWNSGDRTGIDIKDYSHWRGVGPWQDREKWLALGRVHFEMYEQ